MTVVHIAYRYGQDNTGGAAIASTRLHTALLRHGIASHYVCIHAHEKGTNVYVLPCRWRRWIYFAFVKVFRCFWKITAYRKSICLNLVPLWGLRQLLDKLQPDVIHVQWINSDVMSLKQLARLRTMFPSARIVLNLHDFFMVNALAPHPFLDIRYIRGFAKGNSTFIERWLFDRKRRAVTSLQNNVVFLGPSNWCVSCVRKSLIGRGIPAVSIPNIVDLRFCYRPELCVKHSRFRILFGAYGGRNNPTKGFADLADALALLSVEVRSNMDLYIFGEQGTDCETEGVQTHLVGVLSSVEDMVKVYHSADVFAFPSLAETQGMTKVEAMLCGLPVVAFDRTACAEGIIQTETGWKADGRESFAMGLEYFYKHRPDRRRVSQFASLMFNSDRLCEQIFDVYEGKGGVG